MQRWNQKMLSSQDCVQSRLSISRLSLITAACNQRYTCNQSFNQHAQCISNTQTNTFITKMHIHIKSTWNVKQSIRKLQAAVPLYQRAHRKQSIHVIVLILHRMQCGHCQQEIHKQSNTSNQHCTVYTGHAICKMIKAAIYGDHEI